MKKQLLALIALTAALTACGTSAPSVFYALDYNTPANTFQAGQNAVISVASVQIPAYLDRPQIVLKTQDSPVLLINEFNRWAENLSSASARVLASAINNAAKRNYARSADSRGENTPYRLFVQIVHLDATAGGDALLDAWWSVATPDGAPVYTAHSVLKQSAGDSYDDIVRAQNALLTRLGDKIAQYCLKNIKK